MQAPSSRRQAWCARLGPLLRPLLLLALVLYLRNLASLLRAPEALPAPEEPPRAPAGAAAAPAPAPADLDPCGAPYGQPLDALLVDAAAVAALAPRMHNLTEQDAANLRMAPLYALRRFGALAAQPEFGAAARALRAASRRAAAAPPLRVLLFSGSAAFWGFDGGAGGKAVLGEILQWSDLWAALLALGARVHFAHSARGCGSAGGPCCHHDGTHALRHLAAYDAVFVDYVALKWLRAQGARARLRREALFLLDSFGTSAAANALPQAAGTAAGIGLFCCEGLDLAHVLTLGPAPGNTLLGTAVFAAAPAAAGAAAARLPRVAEEVLALPPAARPRLLLLHGKQCAFLPPAAAPMGAALRAVLAAFHAAGFLLLDTMDWGGCGGGHRPAEVVSLGVLAPAAMRRLQGEAHVLLGLGKPLLGPQALEALADGMAVALPRYASPRNCTNDAELASKPTCPDWPHQHPAMEGLPGVRVFSPYSAEEVAALVAGLAGGGAARGGRAPGEAVALPRGFAPGEFVGTVAGLLEGLPDAPPTPPPQPPQPQQPPLRARAPPVELAAQAPAPGLEMGAEGQPDAAAAPAAPPVPLSPSPPAPASAPALPVAVQPPAAAGGPGEQEGDGGGGEREEEEEEEKEEKLQQQQQQQQQQQGGIDELGQGTLLIDPIFKGLIGTVPRADLLRMSAIKRASQSQGY
jgi:hypothetical protein